jgi:transglutaminase-like putative cysteine protease
MKFRLPWIGKMGADFMGAFGLPRLERQMVVQALACFGVALVPHLFHLAWWLILMALGVALWRWASLRKQVRLPPGIFFVLVIPVLILGVAMTYGTVTGRDGGTGLLFGFFCLKMLELRNRKDFLVVTGVSYALILTAVLFTQSLLMCLYLLFQFWFTTTCLVRIYGRRSDQQREKRTAGRLAAMVLLKSLPLALVLFVFFPRIDAQLRFSPFDPASGFADSMSPGSVAGAFSDRSMAFRVEFPDGTIPEPEQLYWRGVILSETQDGMAWERQPFGVQNQRARVSELTARQVQANPNWVRQKISLIPSFQRWVFALDYPVVLPDGGETHLGGVIGWPYKIRSRLQYEVISQPGYRSQEMAENILKRYLQLPDDQEITPRVRELVAGWKRHSTSDAAVVGKAMEYFQSEGFRYSFYPGTYRSQALDRFLFDRKLGFCEHFSGSLATLMRLAGIPARVVLGFQGGEMNPYGEFMLVRKQNAHSWVEVWLDEQGWVRVDPTSVVAPQRLTGGMRLLEELIGRGFGISIAGMDFYLFPPGWLPEPVAAVLDEMRNRIDNLNRKWDEMLGFDYGRQVELMGDLGVKNSPVVGMLSVLGGLAALILLMLWISSMRQTIRPRAEDQIFMQLARKLKGQGLEKSPYEGVQTYLMRAGETLPRAQNFLGEFSVIYHDLKYRKRQPPRASASLQKMKDLLAQSGL